MPDNHRDNRNAACNQYQQVRYPWERCRLTRQMGENPLQTDQSQGNDTNVNNIVERFARTGVLPAPNQGAAQYGDVTALQGDLTEIIANGEKAKTAMTKLQNEQREQKELQQQERDKRLEVLEAAETARNAQPTPE